MRVAEAVRLEGEVLQQPTMPVVKETNMKKKATMKRAIIERPMSEKEKKIMKHHLPVAAARGTSEAFYCNNQLCIIIS
jgi:hypothetical protein